ncbi:MAG TPA: DNA primase [Stellaceae bacterium]|nr:DNA primase [Stellaceae bacterium]
MAFPPRFLDEIRQRVSLAEIVGRRVKLIRRGREFTGLCPFHNEKTPSFSVVEDKGFYHCFGCGAHGDAIGFTMQTENLSFPEAVEQLARRAGLEVPQESREERERAAREATLQGAVDAACAFFEKMLHGPEGRAARAYLERRGLDDATIRRFRLGFAPDGRDKLKRAVMSGTITESLLIEAGLLRKPEGDGDSYDYFRNRVIFPIGDRRGRIIAFGGRVMDDGQPKYLNSPDTPLFNKGRNLYGWALARVAAAKDPSVIVVEGYMDVIALHRAGFATAVAPLGTALTEAQIEELWRMAPEPVLCFDGDAAGQRAAARALSRALPILKPGLSLRFAILPASEDPDSLILHHGAEAMRALLDRAEPLAEVLWRLETAKPADTPERRAALEKRLDQQVRLIADRSVQEHYRNFCRERLADAFGARRGPVGGRTLTQRFGGTRWPERGDRGRSRRFAPPPPWREAAPQGDPQLLARRREEITLALVLNHPELLNEVEEEFAQLEFRSPDLDKLRIAILKTHAPQPDLDAETLIRHLRDDGFAKAVEGVLSAQVLNHAAFARTDADAETVRLGWADTRSRFEKRRLGVQIRDAERDLAGDMSVENWTRLQPLLEDKDEGESAL